ncbi:MAG: T9SS type A sorting domain-containing protein [Bacteroidota bacterium]
MKKLLLLSAFCISILGASAQITINTSDVAAVNKVFFQATDTLPSISIGSAGASQIWNMTNLQKHIQDTITFLPYSAAPNPKFSTSNLVIKIGNMAPAYLYAVNSTASLTALGYSAVFVGPVTISNTPAEIIANFPSNFGNSFTSNYKTFSQQYFGFFGVDSIRNRGSVKKTVLIDAWGNITTPFYSNTPVLRFKETKISYDTTDLQIAGVWNNNYERSADSTTTYSWWAKNIGFPIVTATKDSSNTVVSVDWISGTSAVGITEKVPSFGVNVYPNPAQNEIHFSINTPIEAISIQVFDVTGRMITEHAVKNDMSTINTSHFADGVYIYSIIGKENVVLDQGKFTVSK